MSTRAINLNDVLNYELAAVPTSMFDEKSGLRISMSKYILKRKHEVEVTNPSICIRDAVVIGGCARPCVLQWPSKGLINNVVLNFIKYATNKINSYNGHMHYLIDITRASRMPSAPQHQVVLSVTKNKVQLIDLICAELQKRDDQHLKTSLVITGRYPVLMKVRSKALVQRIDLNTHMKRQMASFLSK